MHEELKKGYLQDKSGVGSDAIVIDCFDMSHCSPVKSTSPADFKPKAATDGEYDTAEHLPYPQIVGSLLYAAVITRPDIAQAVSVLSRYLAKWSDSQYPAAKHLLRYIRGISDLYLVMD